MSPLDVTSTTDRALAAPGVFHSGLSIAGVSPLGCTVTQGATLTLAKLQPATPPATPCLTTFPISCMMSKRVAERLVGRVYEFYDHWLRFGPVLHNCRSAGSTDAPPNRQIS